MDEMVHVDQKAALGSTTTQIGVQNNYIGMTPEEASAMALKLFMDNFPKLQEQAAQVARERADDFMKSVMDKLQEKETKDYSAFADPDVQYILYETQKKYARMGTQDMLNILSEIISQRILCDDDFVRKIIIDQAANTAVLLKPEHLDTLALILLSKYVGLKCESIKDLGITLEYWAAIFPRAKASHIFFLNSQGCLELNITSISKSLSNNFGFSEKEIKEICPPSIMALTSDYGLSLVGKMIAIAHIERLTKYRFNLNSFIC